MIKILFVCLGNICRSPMAEFVMKQLVAQAGREAEFSIASAGTSAEEAGNPVYPPVKKLLTAHGIDCSRKTARQLTASDYDEYDLLIGMEAANLRAMQRVFSGDKAGKLHLLRDYTAHPGDITDPWYTRDFEATWRDVQAGCAGLLETL